MLSRFIRGAGMGLGASGIVFTVWFFFLSSSEFKYLWGGLSVALFFVGYLFGSELTARGVNIAPERSANRNIDTVFLQYFGKAPEPFPIASYVIVFPYVVYGN